MMTYVMSSSSHPSVFTVLHLDSGLIEAINPTTLLSRFPFFFTYLDSCPNFSNLELFQLTLVRTDTPKVSIILRYSESDLLLFGYLPPILFILKVKRILLLILLILSSMLYQILVVLISPLAPNIVPTNANLC